MALIKYSLTLVAKQDAPFNVLPNTDVTIRRVSDNGLVLIYSDADGLIPIAQPGAKTNPRGVFEFYTDSLPVVKAVWSDGGNTYEEVFNGNSLQALSGLTEPSDLDSVFSRSFSSVASMKSFVGLSDGYSVKTASYYEGWAALLKPAGGATYLITTLQKIRDTLIDPAWTPDEYGDHTLSNGLVAKLQAEGYVTPEQYGAKGDGIYDDSLHVVAYMAAVRKQRWTPGNTYVLDADTTGDNRAFRVYSDTEMVGYGAKIDLKGVTNNGFYYSADEGSVFRTQIRGFTFIQSDVATIAAAIFIEGFIEDTIIEDCVADSLDQYFLGMGNVSSGFKNLTIRNNKAKNINPQADNEFSLCFEFYPKVASSGLEFYGNNGEQSGWGSVFKIHNVTGAHVHNNKFSRTTNAANSQSQAVMLGGRATDPVHDVDFHDNEITDANTSFGAMFMGNNSTKLKVHDNDVSGAGGNIWVGNSITDSELRDNKLSGSILSLSVSINNVNDLTIEGNEVAQINFQAPSGGGAPDTIDGLFVLRNKIRLGIRIDAVTSSANVMVADNDFIDVNSVTFLYADNIDFKYNRISVSDVWSSGAQVVIATGANYKQMNNTWDLKGLVTQPTWLNGATDPQIVGETVEDAVTRLVLNNGVNSQLFDNRLRLSGGAWAIV